MGKADKMLELVEEITKCIDEDIDKSGCLVLIGVDDRVVCASKGNDSYVFAALCDMFDREPRMYKYISYVLKTYKRFQFKKKLQAFKDKFSIQIELWK